MKTNSVFRSVYSAAVLGAVLFYVFPALSGCLAVAAGAGAGVVAYVRGDLETTVTSDYNAVVEASRAAIKSLEFTPSSDHKDAFRAELLARTALDKKVQISLTNAGKDLTHIKIRVDFFGNEQMSISILEKIKEKL